MTPTLHSYFQALQMPEYSFTTLREARAVTDATGMPRISRTTLFAEAEIEWQGSKWLLFLPLSPSALQRIERTATQLKQLNTDFLTEYRILPGEMVYSDSTGAQYRADLVLQRLPAGQTLTEAITTENKEILLEAIDTLQEGLKALGFNHNNLKAENLIWSGGRLLPIRYHHARLDSGDDSEAFETLRQKIAEVPESQTVCDTTSPYTPQRPLTGHLWTSHLFEQLICVEDETGFGYVDTTNRMVIPAQYLWAGDFHEGRAEVQTDTGMGLIDKTGRYIIPPEYEIVEYDPAKSISRVRLRSHWALFDYLGRRLTEFRETVEA